MSPEELIFTCETLVCEIIEVRLLWYVLPDELVCIFNVPFLDSFSV